MKYTNQLINILLLFLLSQQTFSQQFNNFAFYCKDADKITLSTLSHIDKNTISTKNTIDSISKLPYPVEENIKQDTTVIEKVDLNIKERKSLYKKMKTIEKGHSLPYEYDIELDFYSKNKIVQTVTISSYTKNIIIKKKGCKTYIDDNGQEIDPCFFRGIVSNELKKYIVNLLKKKKLWNKEHEFFEDL